MEDIAQVLAYEIKQEIAQRYFGFRTRIEGEIDQYRKDLHIQSSRFVPDIEVELQRLQFLLFDKTLFHNLLSLTNLPDSFTQQFSLSLPTSHNNALWKDLFTNLKAPGFTRKGRYKKLVLTVYNSLRTHISEYNHAYDALEEEHIYICEEIAKFYKNNDLSGILSFLREIHDPDLGRSTALQTIATSGKGLDKDMRIKLPSSVAETMEPLANLPDQTTIKQQIQQIIDAAYPLAKNAPGNSLPF